MGCYYVMVHFDGPYVTGIVVPEARNAKHALSVLKTLLRAKINIEKTKDQSNRSMDECGLEKLKEIMRSVKRPWRCSGNNRRNKEKIATSVSRSKVVRVTQMKLPVLSGYWLTDLITGSHLCNQHDI